MIRVDAHLHVWRAGPPGANATSTLVPPSIDVAIEDARRVMVEHDIARAVLVQPVFRGADNDYVAACARAEPNRFAAVAAFDPGIECPEALLEHCAGQGCRGFRLRPRLTTEEKLFGDPAIYSLWETATRLGMVISVLCGPQHLGMLSSLADRFTEVPIVIDHLGHPNPAIGVDHPQFRQLLALASRPRVFVKLSGYYHFSDADFPYENCWSLIRAVYEQFGPRRLLWGSDFPHVTVASGYGPCQCLLERVLDDWPAADRDAVMGQNARELYWPKTVSI